MKKYKAILFDMDGTLVPMDQEEFTHGYFKFLAKKLLPYGIEKEKLVPSIWEGTAAMVRNTGEKKNSEVFWDYFEQITGIGEAVIGDACLDFYGNEFRQAKMFTQENPLAKEAVQVAHEKADFVALATNPLFPMVGQKTRMNWVGLSEEDFDLVTSYESDSYCKPNPQYFISVCERLGVEPKDCLLIGNDENEDMYAGTLAGLNCYLVTDTRIASEKHPWTGESGTFAEMVEMLKAL